MAESRERERALEEAEKIAKRLREQDNRITEAPIFVVEQKRRIYGVDSDYTDRFVWVDPDGCENASDTPRKGWRKVGYVEVWDFATACLTEAGCEEYLRVNGHNLTEPRIHAYSGWRNSEWKGLRSMMPALSTPSEEPERGEATEDELWQLDQAILDAERAPRPDNQIATLRRLYAKLSPPTPENPEGPEGEPACDFEPCIMCGKAACTVEDCKDHPDGAQTRGGSWTCSPTCWDAAATTFGYRGEAEREEEPEGKRVEEPVNLREQNEELIEENQRLRGLFVDLRERIEALENPPRKPPGMRFVRNLELIKDVADLRERLEDCEEWIASDAGGLHGDVWYPLLDRIRARVEARRTPQPGQGDEHE